MAGRKYSSLGASIVTQPEHAQRPQAMTEDIPGILNCSKTREEQALRRDATDIFPLHTLRYPTLTWAKMRKRGRTEISEENFPRGNILRSAKESQLGKEKLDMQLLHEAEKERQGKTD